MAIAALDGGTLREFSEKVARYFLDFLQSDFKRQPAPRRRLQHDKASSHIRLEQFPKLASAFRSLLKEQTKEWKPIVVARGSFTRRLSNTMLDYLEKHIEAISDDVFDDYRASVQSFVELSVSGAGEDHEEWIESALFHASAEADDRIVRPLLNSVRSTILRDAAEPDDRAFELETALVGTVTSGLAQTLASALNDYRVNGEIAAVEDVLRTQISPDGTRSALKEAAAEFWMADAYDELRDLVTFTSSGENLQVYLYVGAMTYHTQTYPLFYVPISVSTEPGAYGLQLEPHLYINRQALEFVLQDLAGGNSAIVSPVRERIVYLSPEDRAATELDARIATLCGALGLPRVVNLVGSDREREVTLQVAVQNSLFVAAFDRADEALVNDYEEILAAANDGGDAITRLFQDIIKAVISEEPVSLTAEVEQQWEDAPLSQRLIADSPIPLNEEQRKILIALSHPSCRFVVVQGPPGTGKSHTITAIAFEAIRTGKAALILSDKTEALDVVEEKLEETIAQIRPTEDFPNPILRLGKSGSNFARLVSLSSAQKIMREHSAAQAHMGRLTAEQTRSHDALRDGLDKSAADFSHEMLDRILRLHDLEQWFSENVDVSEALQLAVGACLDSVLQDFVKASELVAYDAAGVDAVIASCIRPLTLEKIRDELRRRIIASEVRASLPLGAMKEFEPFGVLGAKAMIAALTEYEELRRPIIGYLFRGDKVRRIEANIRELVPARAVLSLGRQPDTFRTVAQAVFTIADRARTVGLGDDDVPAVYQLVVDDEPVALDDTILQTLNSLSRVLAADIYAPNRVESALQAACDRGIGGEFLGRVIEYAVLWTLCQAAFRRLGTLDFIGKKTQLERLNVREMANGIDEKFVKLVTEHPADSRALARVIREKGKFPADRFELLKGSFPVIIASIREFSEYMPLLPGIFDLVIIDEASQVSVAQAFPALLRAKQVVVFGDFKQFSNVKSANASNERNRVYRNDIEAFVRQRIAHDSATLARIVSFDVKKSVLEFFENCANYRIMLRKHFRGYQELIGFSSRTFYRGELQAIKVRNLPIEDVIRFEVVGASAETDHLRNVNEGEAAFIIDRLVDLLDDHDPPSVCIITPFREQQSFIAKLVAEHARSDDFRRILHLRVMTFDTCQGIERDIVFYSLVERDKRILNYIFPVSIDQLEDTVEEKIKAQRLNVGLSRAKELMWFVLSKPISEYIGSIGAALRYYDNALQTADEVSVSQTDRRSQMEPKVLEWIKQTPFFQRGGEAIKLTPQFQIGRYLRQLDPRYHHPEWVADFLLRYESPSGPLEIVVEYDGFDAHFKGRDTTEINASNYESYMSEGDIERQLTLEQYGYRFVRLNRFNVGRDPVQTISAMLERVVKNADVRDPEAISQIRDDAAGLGDGSRKRCSRCNQIRELSEFHDRSLRDGAGGYGRICIVCKNAFKPKPRPRGYSPRWQYRRKRF
jgi:DNA polymerase III delta prime subunit